MKPIMIVVTTLIVGFSCAIVGFGMSMKSEDVVQLTVICFGIGALIGFVTIYNYQRRKDDLALFETNLAANKDLPPSDSNTIEIESILKIRIELVREDDGFISVDWFDLPGDISARQLIDTGKLLVDNKMNFSHAISGNGRPLTRPQFEDLRDVMVARGLAKWRNQHSKNQGVVLNQPGVRMFKQLALTHEGDTLPRIIQVLASAHAHTHTQESRND
jgi:hypothetical protein